MSAVRFIPVGIEFIREHYEEDVFDLDWPTPRACVSGSVSCNYRAEQIYRCPRCNQVRCYCNGCSDDMPDLCDHCWCELTAIIKAKGCAEDVL